MQLIQVITTINSQEKAQDLCLSIVQEKLGACCQIEGPITSIYPWKGSIQQDTEWRCTIKTIPSKETALKKFILSNHPYDTPEILSTPIVSIHKDYSDWIANTFAQ